MVMSAIEMPINKNTEQTQTSSMEFEGETSPPPPKKKTQPNKPKESKKPCLTFSTHSLILRKEEITTTITSF